jgi:hypothetical protein
MTTVLVLDTCVLPQKGSIRSNPILSALLRICAIRGFSIYISDVTRTESLNKRRVLASKAITNLGSAVREISKVFGLDELDYYIPSEVEAVEAWDQELSEAFSILETDGEDAKEALHREASRTPPARATDSGSATGGRDSAIWLSIKRIHLAAKDQTTHFVSSNTKDFASSADNRLLRSELSAELGATAGNFVYAPSLEVAVEHLAPSSDLQELGFDELQGLILDIEVQQQLLSVLQSSVHGRELPQPVTLSVGEVRERRAYNVETLRLSQIDIEFGCLSTAWKEEDPSPSEFVQGRASAWLYRSDEAASFELETMTFSGATFKVH